MKFRTLSLMIFTLTICWTVKALIAQVPALTDADLKAAIELVGEKASFLGGQKQFKNSVIHKFDAFNCGNKDCNSLSFDIQSPKARALEYANWASENFVELDSTNWIPGRFNRGVYVFASGDSKLSVNRIVAVTSQDEKVIEPLETSTDSTAWFNMMGAEWKSTSVGSIYSLDAFFDKGDITFYVFTSEGRRKFKIKASELSKLE